MTRYWDDITGKVVATGTDNSTRCKFDTCDCWLAYEPDGTLLYAFNKCKLHESISDNTIVNIVLAHNNGFNLKFGTKKLTVAEKETIANDKTRELKRVKKL